MPAEAVVNESTEQRAARWVIVVTGAEPFDQHVIDDIPNDAEVIAADSGLDHALAVGLTPSTVVGDFDSISEAGRRWADANATMISHPVDKDATDTELALALAADLNPDHLVLVSGGGDRLDHIFAAIGALTSSVLVSVPVLEARWGSERIRVLHGPGRATIPTTVGATVSVLALAGPATGVGLTGTKWTLDHDELRPLAGRGVSNVATDDTVTVTVTTGVLAVFHSCGAAAS
jgi:thiamine pyrophosphokinase